jgi:DNA repair exonuclease SbcCD nuclease subunit
VAKFRFIHLSDFHFCLRPLRRNLRSLHRRRLWEQLDNIKDQAHDLGLSSLISPSSYDPAVTAAAARFCYDRRNSIDAIIVSGDLATTGKPIDLAPARSFVEDAGVSGPYINFMSQTLAATGRPIYFLPGNHDMYRDDSGLPGSPHFHLMLEQHLPNRNGAVGWWTRTKPSSGQKLGCVYGDFTLRSVMDAQNPAFYHGRGRVYPDVLSDMIERTEDLKASDENMAIIWLIHFAPFAMCPTELHLIDWQNVVAAAERLGVICTLCGHTHQQNRMSRDNHVLYCSGSAGSVDPIGESRVHVIEIDAEQRNVKRVNFEYAVQAQAFRYASTD